MDTARPPQAGNRALIVQKYGGTSLGTPERIRSVAAKIAGRAADGTGVIVIVSAMGQSTDDLLKLAAEITDSPSQRELDMLLTVGERISMALLSMALNAIGCSAISFTGSQGGIVTSPGHTRAQIEEIRPGRIEQELARGRIVIVAGFQGVSREREITTLGRGGSDTTAVALAASLGANRCEIYSDYDGVFTADPRRVPSARRIARIDFDTMLELAARGAGVLHYRAAEIARRCRVPLLLKSTFNDGDGTTVGRERPMESPTATAVTCEDNAVLIRINAPHSSDAIDAVVQELDASDVRLLACMRTVDDANATLALLVHSDDADTVQKTVGRHSGVQAASPVDVSAVSVVGCGFACNIHALAAVERVIRAEGVRVHLVTSSPLSITCVVPRSDADRTVTALHAALIEND